MFANIFRVQIVPPVAMLPPSFYLWLIAGLFVMCLLQALVIQISTRLVGGFIPKFTRALGALLAFAILSSVITVGLNLLSMWPETVGGRVLLAIGLVAMNAAIHSATLAGFKGEGVSFLGACLILLLQIPVAFGVGATIGLFIWTVGLSAIVGGATASKADSGHPTASPVSVLDSILFGKLAKGDRVQLARNCTLYFRKTAYRTGIAGEEFVVAEFRPAEARVFLVAKDGAGQPIALHVATRDVRKR